MEKLYDNIDNIICKAWKEAKGEAFALTNILQKKSFPKVIGIIVPNQLKEKLFLSTIAVWLPEFREGRALAFESFGVDKNITELKDIAELNIEIFGRGTTLNERLLNFVGKCKQNVGMITINCQEKDTFNIQIDATENNRLVFDVGYIWNDLKPKNEFFGKPKELMTYSKKYSITDVSRAVKLEFNEELEKQRQKVLNTLLNEEYLETLFKAMKILRTPEEDIKNEKERIPLGQNFEIIMSFIRFIQALAHFIPAIHSKAQKICGIAYFPSSVSSASKISFPSRGSAINLIGAENMNITNDEFSFLSCMLKWVYRTLSEKFLLKAEEKKEMQYPKDLEGDEGLFREAVQKTINESKRKK